MNKRIILAAKYGAFAGFVLTVRGQRKCKVDKLCKVIVELLSAAKRKGFRQRGEKFSGFSADHCPAYK